jgi:sugar phosphate isomerase/epimerase
VYSWDSAPGDSGPWGRHILAQGEKVGTRSALSGVGSCFVPATDMTFTRRDLLKGALAALPFAKSDLSAASFTRPDSKYGGVQIGVIISPYNYPDIPVRADETLKTLLQLGISAFEMQDVRAETYAGAPSQPREGYSGSPRRISGLGPNASLQQLREARQKLAAGLKQWRLSVPLSRYESLRKLYNDAGVNIYAFRLAHMTQATSDAEFEYFFHAAQALGANQITVELPEDTSLTKRVAEFAAKYKIRMGYHNHTQVNDHSWDTALSQSEYNGINLDVGHFVAATNHSPIPFIKEHHDRITSLHLKDRKFRTHGGENMPWGRGDTPLKGILQLMKTENYQFPAAIELEYPIPAGSTACAKIAKCLQFCKDALA